MHIVIDVRSLCNSHQTGVGQFTSGVVQGLKTYTNHTYYYYYNAAKKITLPSYIAHDPNVYHTRFPSRLLTLCSSFVHMPKVDTLVDAHIDLIYTPNIQYVPHHTKTPYICTIHDLSFVHMPAWFTKKQRLWHYLQRVKYQAVRSTAIIVPSESTKSDVVHTFDIPESKVHVVYPGIDQSAYAVISDEDTQLVQQTYHLDRPYILYLGTIEPRKNITMLIESYVHGMYNKKGIELIVAGAPGWNNKDILRAIDTTPGVRYIGYVPAAHKAALYRGAAVFVYPSLFEGFGFPVLEAMAQGTPVITSNRTSLPEITYGQVQYIYPYRIDECISAIDEALSHPRLSDARNISQKYTWEHTAHQLGVIFEQYK